MPASIYGAEAFPIAALTAGGNVEKLIEQARALQAQARRDRRRETLLTR